MNECNNLIYLVVGCKRLDKYSTGVYITYIIQKSVAFTTWAFEIVQYKFVMIGDLQTSRKNRFQFVVCRCRTVHNCENVIGLTSS